MRPVSATPASYRVKPMSEPRQKLVTTAAGSNLQAFGATEWSMLSATSLIWGSSFLWITIALRSLEPTAVGFLRVLLGAAVLALIPRARTPIARRDWPRVAIIAVAGNAGPALLFAHAQQTVDSSVAGMVNSATPLVTMAVTIVITRTAPGRAQVAGLLIGFAGIVAMTLPNLYGADASPAGVAFLLLAIVGYGVSGNVVVPLQQRYGALPVIMRALALGAVVSAPLGAFGLSRSSLEWGSVAAILVLGILGTGVARALAAALAGRAGAVRGAIITYFVPLFAISLGVMVLGETVTSMELAGVALILVGGYFTTRRDSSTLANGRNRWSGVAG